MEQCDHPLSARDKPQVGVRTLVPAAGPPGDSARQDTLLLDRVLEQSKKMRAELGVADQSRLDEYLSIVRSLETRMERARDPKRTWKPLVSLDSAPRPAEIRRPTRSTSASCWI